MKSYRFAPDNAPETGNQYCGFTTMLYRAIADAGTGLHYCEIGTGEGETALVASCHPAISHVTTIDQRITPGAVERLRPVAHKVTMLRAKSSDCAGEVGRIDLLYIDGNHSREGVLQDLENYTPLVTSRGIIAGHDYSPAWPGVILAVDEWAEKTGKEIFRYCDGSWRLV